MDSNITTADVATTYKPTNNAQKADSAKAKKFMDTLIQYGTKIDKSELRKIKQLAIDGDAEKLSQYLKVKGIDFDVYDTKDFDEFVPTVELPYRAASSEKDWTPGSKIQPSKKISKTVISVFKRGMQDANGNLEQFFQKMSTLGEAIAVVAGATEDKLRPSKMDKAAATQILKDLPADRDWETLF